MLFCQAVIAVTFAWSAVTKLAGRAAFAEFRHWLAVAVRVPPSVAVAVVAAEAATAVAVLVPTPAPFAVAALLLAVFTAAVAAMWRRRVTVPCRCFGAGRYPPGPVQLVRNGVLLLVAVAGGILSWAGAPSGGVGAAVAGAAGALLLIELEDIVAVIRPRPAARTTGG